MISVIIPSYNEERFLPKLLSSLAKQQTEQKFEVILVDGNSVDGTLREAERFIKKLPLRIVKAKKRGVAEQRNEGIEKARGEWLIFIDADNTLPPHFIDQFALAIEENTFDLAIFKLYIDPLWPTIYRLIFRIIHMALLVWGLFGPEVQHGGCIAIKRSHIKHNFDTDVEVLEDYIFAQKNVRAGARFTYLNNPQFNMSLRRFKRDGLLLTLTKNSWHLASYLIFNKRFLTKVTYSMDGGSNYRDNDE